MNYRVEVNAIDRDGVLGRTMVRFSPPSSFMAAVTQTMEPFASAIEGLTDAVIVNYRGVWTDTVTPAFTPPPGINLQVKAIFIIRTPDDEYIGFTIPAPKASIFEDSGPWAGIRVKQAVIDDMLAFFDTFPLSDPIDPGNPVVIAELIGVKGY